MKRVIIALAIFFCSTTTFAAEAIKVGVLPIEDAVPLYVAQQKNLFQKEHLKVELIPFQSAVERDSALAANAIDGAIDDPIGAILFDKGQKRLKITTICLGATPQEGIFAILVGPNSSINTPSDLRGVEIAVSKSTIIEYVTDRLLIDNGITPEEIKKIEVVKMPIRMQMLLSGSVMAATLPEPLASIAIAKGAKVIMSDDKSKESLSQTVLVFRHEYYQQNHSSIVAFFKAYKEAVVRINSAPEEYREIFMEKGRIPESLSGAYVIPHFPMPEPFPKSLYAPIIEWLEAKTLTPHLPYSTIVAEDFMKIHE